MELLTSDDKTMFALALNGGYSQFTKYYFDWEPLKNQWIEHYASLPNATHLGGIGSGKTKGKAMSMLTKALTQPWYWGLNTSISAFQAKLLHEAILPFLDSPKVSRFVTSQRAKPYPLIEFVWGSKIACMTAGWQAENIRGSEWDEINGDEFGYERHEETILALRGRLRGTRPNGIARLARLTITTTPTDVPWLRVRYDRGDKSSVDYDPTYCSFRSTLFDNKYIPDWQKEQIVKDMPAEMVEQEVNAQFPDWGDSEFAERYINACEDMWLNAHMEQLINPMYVDEQGNEHAGKPLDGAAVIELPRHGVIRWEMPYDATRVYVMSTDPGTTSPPKRNAAVVLVFDVTAKPYQLVYFHWVMGNGSYLPWLSSFRYALEKYHPILKGLDATGTQKAIDELVLEREGIQADSVNFARDKMGMLNALKLMLQAAEVRFPFIKGLRGQLRSYKAKDDDIAQDIVAALMVFAYVVRFVPNSVPSQKQTVLVASGYDPSRGRKDIKNAVRNQRKLRRARR